MKRIFIILLFLGVINLSFGWFWAEVDMYKDNLPSLQEMEYFKTLLPKEKGWINDAVWAYKTGQQYEYWFEIDLVTEYPSRQIQRVEIEHPDGSTQPFDYEGSYLYEGDTYFEYYFETGYFSFEDMKAEFPAGNYILRIVFKDGTTEEETVTLPNYSDDDFPGLVEGDVFWEDNVLKLNFSTVADADEYYWVELENVKTDKTLWDNDDDYMVFSHPDSVTLDFDYLGKKGKYDYEVDVETESQLGDDVVEIWMVSTMNWWEFKKPLPAYEDKVTKSTVTAGAKNVGSLSFSGQLQAVEADLLHADNIHMKISCDTMQESIGLEFPISPATLKKGNFSSTIPLANSKATASLKYSTKTHTFVCSLKNYDLTGLSCPITVDLGIGQYCNAAITMDEDIVNGAKACSPQLIQGLADSLVVEKSLLTAGKQYGLDTFSAQGVFTFTGTPDMNANPFVITLGKQTFTVASTWFTVKNGVYSCKNAPTQENWNGEKITATLNTVKCTFTVSIKYAYLSAAGISDFGLDIFGCPLTGLTTVTVSAMYSYWDLTRYDQLGSQWVYNSDIGIAGTNVTVNDNGDSNYKIIEDELDIMAVQFYAKDPDGGMRFKGLVLDSSDPDIYLGIDCDLLMWWPERLRPGHTRTASSGASGTMSTSDGDVDIVPGTATSKVSISSKMSRVTVPAGIYDTVPFTESWTFGGKLQYNGTIRGSIKVVVTQTSYAVPDYGVVKRTRKMTLIASITGYGTISDTMSDVYQLHHE